MLYIKIGRLRKSAFFILLLNKSDRSTLIAANKLDFPLPFGPKIKALFTRRSDSNFMVFVSFNVLIRLPATIENSVSSL